MDGLTEKHIRMAREATEIQKKWNPKPGDFAFLPWMINPMVGNYEFTILTNDYRDRNLKGEATWIPSQEQIQAMFDVSVSKLLTDFYDWAMGDNIFIFSTMGQLWLGFIMKKKYRKEWNGRKWERIKNDKKI